MFLTEEQITTREIAFFDLIEEVVMNNFDIPEEYQMTEEDAYITSILLDYFVENYKELSISESTLIEKYGVDINQPLYDEMVVFILDEGIGKYVAGAYYGAKRMVDRAKYDFSKGYTSALKSKASKAKAKLSSAVSQEKQAKTTGGLKGEFMRGLTQSRVKTATKKYEKAAAKHSSAAGTRDMLKNPLKASTATREKQKSDLAKKIDTGLSNIKKRATDKIKSGVSRLGSAIGKFA